MLLTILDKVSIALYERMTLWQKRWQGTLSGWEFRIFFHLQISASDFLMNSRNEKSTHIIEFIQNFQYMHQTWFGFQINNYMFLLCCFWQGNISIFMYFYQIIYFSFWLKLLQILQTLPLQYAEHWFSKTLTTLVLFIVQTL